MAAVFRVNKNENYTVLSNYHFRERGLSLKAKGLLSLMLSLPDDWDFSAAGLVKLSKDGKDSVNAALKELEKFGYLKRTQAFNESGKFDGYIYEIFESPTESTFAENPLTENPSTEKPITEKPLTENPQQLNTKELNTKKLNTKQSSTKEKERKKGAASSYDEIIAERIFDDEVKTAIYEFIKMRKLIKKPMTDFALTKLLNKLEKLSFDPRVQVEILEKSIMNNWQDIYELKADQPNQQRAQQSSGNPFLDALGDIV